MLRNALAMLPLLGCDRVFGTTFDDRDADMTRDSGPVDADFSGCLRDTFEDGEIDPFKWVVKEPEEPQITVQETNGHLVMTLAAATSSSYRGNQLRATTQFDVTDGYAVVEVLEPTLASGTESYLALEGTASPLARYSIVASNGRMSFNVWVNGQLDETVGRDWLISDHFWRIRHDGIADKIHMEVSPDASTWNPGATFTPKIPVTRLRATLGAGHYQARVEEVVAMFDNFELVTAECPPLVLP